MSFFEIRNVSKKFTTQTVLELIDMDLGLQDCTALLGGNGAGKSTLLQILSGNLSPSSGTVSIGGQRLLSTDWQLKSTIGYLPQRLLLPLWATPWELLTYACALRNISHGKEVAKKELETWGGGHFLSVPIEHCSHGMKKLVGLALATFFDPQLLILDEPHAGLDVYHIRLLETYLETRKRTGKPTLVSCHLLPVLAKFVTQAYFLQNGCINKAEFSHGAGYQERLTVLETLVFSS
jgi:ABC-type multidrug transport system ATPase subunit